MEDLLYDSKERNSRIFRIVSKVSKKTDGFPDSSGRWLWGNLVTVEVDLRVKIETNFWDVKSLAKVGIWENNRGWHVFGPYPANQQAFSLNRMIFLAEAGLLAPNYDNKNDVRDSS